MARPIRIELDGALCHVTSRGDRRAPAFRAWDAIKLDLTPPFLPF